MKLYKYGKKETYEYFSTEILLQSSEKKTPKLLNIPFAHWV